MMAKVSRRKMRKVLLLGRGGDGLTVVADVNDSGPIIREGKKNQNGIWLPSSCVMYRIVRLKKRTHFLLPSKTIYIGVVNMSDDDALEFWKIRARQGRT